jgi:hypothetical protein
VFSSCWSTFHQHRSNAHAICRCICLGLQLDLWSVADANNHLFKLPTLVDMLHELLAPYAELRLTPGGLP